MLQKRRAKGRENTEASHGCPRWRPGAPAVTAQSALPAPPSSNFALPPADFAAVSFKHDAPSTRGQVQTRRLTVGAHAGGCRGSTVENGLYDLQTRGGGL